MRNILRYGENSIRLRQRLAQPLCEELGLSQKGIDVLVFLYNNPERNTARDIVLFLKIAKSNLSVLLEELERDGWLSMETDPQNRRLKRLMLSDERQGELCRLAEFQERFLELFTEGFSAEEISQLHTLLEKMNVNVLKALAESEEKK